MKKRNQLILIGLLVLAVAVPVVRLCVEHAGSQAGSAPAAKEKDYYYCGMHPWFHQDHPGNCGICGMTLIKKGEGGTPTPQAAPGERKVKYWVDSMNPSFRRDQPGKALDGMDLVPVYENEGSEEGIPESLKGLAQVDLSPFKQQLIGLRTDVAQVRPIVRVIRTVGRFGGGPDDFSEAVGDFAAHGNAGSRMGRYLVADVYALDIPYVKLGQRAWVSALSGTGPRVEGKVAEIYPYDGTQSRVGRVKIGFSQVPASELFANVEIEASSQPLLSVPAESVLRTGLHRYVFVKKSEKSFEPREVTVGFEGDEQCQILSGLSGGETVVDGANFLLDADSKLAANFAAMESQSK